MFYSSPRTKEYSWERREYVDIFSFLGSIGSVTFEGECPSESTLLGQEMLKVAARILMEIVYRYSRCESKVKFEESSFSTICSKTRILVSMSDNHKSVILTTEEEPKLRGLAQRKFELKIDRSCCF